MNNIEFGNYLRDLREKKGYTQEYVGRILGITDKAVSKWENGKSSPNVHQLIELSKIYEIDRNELVFKCEERKEPVIHKIVLTGGPCAGKTTALTWIGNYFTEKGYKVLFIPETATELIPNGVNPTSLPNYEFQKLLAKLQLMKEEGYEEVARKMDVDKVLIVCDRGLIDNKAYMTNEEFIKLLDFYKTNLIKAKESYDAVFHLVTAAKGKPEFYTTSNNVARSEGIKEATILDDKLIAAWTGHPHFRIIDNSTDFKEKLERLIKEITSFLGEPEPLEIERKYLIKRPNLNNLLDMPNCTKVEITQTYLKSSDDTERRIRKRSIDGDYMLYLTEKKKINELKRVEVEKRLTEKEYLSLLDEADPERKTITKTRYCLSYNSHYFEIDIYPEWDKEAIMEIELSDENEVVSAPEFIEVIKDVTDDKAYKNYNMAKEMPKQYIK